MTLAIFDERCHDEETVSIHRVGGMVALSSHTLDRIFRIANFQGPVPPPLQGRLAQLAMAMTQSEETAAAAWCTQMEQTLQLPPMPTVGEMEDNIATATNLPVLDLGQLGITSPLADPHTITAPAQQALEEEDLTPTDPYGNRG